MKKHKIFEKIVADIDDYIYFYNNECFQARNKGLVPPLKMRNKARVLNLLLFHCPLDREQFILTT